MRRKESVYEDSLPDFELWNNFLAGDNEAFSCIYRLYIQRLYQYGLLFSGDRYFVKDCVHDVFVKIYNNRSNLSSTDNILFYLSIALKNTIINGLQRQGKVFYQDIIIEPNTIEDYAETPETIYINKEADIMTNNTIKNWMSLLTPRQREVIYYRFVLDLSISEISDTLQMNYQSVSNLIQRALDKIRNLLNKNKKR